jgi:hypothetical protein
MLEGLMVAKIIIPRYKVVYPQTSIVVAVAGNKITNRLW